VRLPDGRQFRLVWSGLMGQVSASLLTRVKNGTLTVAFHCHRCQKSFEVGELYYNRKAHGANRKSSFYCIDCAQTLGLIEAR
jgi:predicted SprT family Zn-dependent metalloprotease